MTSALELPVKCPKCQSLTQSGKFKPEKSTYNKDLDLFHCWLCGYGCKGNPEDKQQEVELLQGVSHMLTQDHVDYCKLMLTQHKPAQDYLVSRFKIIPNDFNLGWEPERNAISIPSYLKGKLVGIKYRHINEDANPRYTSESGSTAGLYLIEGEDKTTLIVEGELDAIAARLLGFTGQIIATQTNRIPNGVKQLLKKQLKNSRWVYCFPDNDIAGQELIESLRQIVPKNKLIECVITEDVKDLGELLQESADIDEAIKTFNTTFEVNKPMVIKDTLRFFDKIEQTVDFLSNKLNVCGDSSGFNSLDNALAGGFRPHEMTIIHATAKTGKTTFATQLMHNLAQSGSKIGFISLEMDPITQVKPSFLSIALQQNVRLLNKKELASAINLAIDKCSFLDSIVFFDRYGATPAQDINDWISYGYEELGITHFFIDHVGYSMEDQVSVSENSKLAKSLKSSTRQYPIHVYPIVQPPKLMPNWKGDVPKLGKDTLFGSASWGQAMDNLITLQRSKDIPDVLEIRLTDARYPLARPTDTAILLSYDRETCTLTE